MTEKQVRIVLIADDNQANIVLVESILRRNKSVEYRFIEAGDGEEALKRLDDSVQLVISDILMPNLNGIELARRLFKSHPDLPVIVTTAFDNMIGEITKLQAELNIVSVQKAPLDFKALELAVEACFEPKQP